MAFDTVDIASGAVVAAAPEVDAACAAGALILVTATAAVDVDTFCAAGTFAFVLTTVVAAVDVEKVCTAGTFRFVSTAGGFGGGGEGVGLMADAFPQTLAMVNAAKTRVMGNE